MRRIRETNINTSDYFNDVFQKDEEYYDNYKNINYYNDKYALRLFDGGSYMDYGCAGGKALNELHNRNQTLQVAGVDISDYVISRNQELYPDVTFLTANEFVDGDQYFDHVVSTHTIEHIENPLKVVALLLERSKKTLTIVVPYKKSWAACDEHLWCFDRHSFDQLNPTFSIRGLTNKAGNTEVVYHWEKDPEMAKKKVAIYRSASPNPFLLMKIRAAVRSCFPSDLKSRVSKFLPSLLDVRHDK